MNFSNYNKHKALVWDGHLSSHNAEKRENNNGGNLIMGEISNGNLCRTKSSRWSWSDGLVEDKGC